MSLVLVVAFPDLVEREDLVERIKGVAAVPVIFHGFTVVIGIAIVS